MRVKNIFYANALAITILAGGCSKEKLDINKNPDDVTDNSVSASVLLPGALQNTSRFVAVDWAFLQMWMGYWARSGSYQSLTEIETYKFGNDFQVGIWNNIYANTNNYNLMQTKATAAGQGMYHAIARIMKAHNFGILVDVYNNVPYFDAFKGTLVTTPKYDKGADIYKDLFVQLDSAVAILRRPSATAAAANPDIATADLVYKGDATKWLKFAHTLRLRLLMHLHNGLTTTQVAAGFNVAGETAKFSAAGFEGFMGAGESAHLNPGFSGTKPNPYYRAYVQNEAGTQTGDVFRANDYAIRYYNADGDPRISRFYAAPAGAAHKGNLFGRPSDASNLYTGEKLSTVRGPGLLPDGAASRAWIITSVESLFLQAEARQRNVLTSGATAKARLTAAVRESFVWLGLTAAQADTYIS
ncbi:MAG: SusD/RagB family nutrient-binding outer membrane lipoprotein, partial [Chitinophagaceae bacterium]